ncbi:uncharacterized protein LOC110737063 [Chenopodium quinoa]|uniref:uncharacterized protein LOC110737063 n=1 Tax=Chenopodium quinoa TaxID=63459 RepID=UPI000B78CF8F|nr:uncharacterized protein LOC110737063 [Chenopodium quinoa]
MVLDMVSFPVITLLFIGFSPGRHLLKYVIITENSTLQEADQLKLKQFLLSKLGKVPDQIRAVVEDTKVEEFVRSPLEYRPPWQVLFGNISKDNVCVTGDACHPMTPDLGQGGCSALEDGVILGRCLADVLLEKSSCQEKQNDENEYERIKRGLNDYAKKRRWRALDLISTGYMLGWAQEFDRFGMRILREKLLSAYLTRFFTKKADIDPGQLVLEH